MGSRSRAITPAGAATDREGERMLKFGVQVLIDYKG
jgi:hypothetical protein